LQRYGRKKVLTKTAIIGFVLAAGTAPAWSEGSGDSFRGQAYSQAMCQSCHSTKADDTASPNPAAPPFRSMKLAYDTGEAFTTYLNTKHPNIMAQINSRQAEDIAAFITSLQPGKTN
jgi:mono/diheme cytochrome c family protein